MWKLINHLMKDIIKKLKYNTPDFIKNYVKSVRFNIKYKHLSEKQDRKIMVIGCGRSGTTFTSKIFKTHNIKIGHERLDNDGISSWYLVSDQDEVFLGPSFNQIKNLNMPIVHQVRHPLKSISSMQAIGWPQLAFSF